LRDFVLNIFGQFNISLFYQTEAFLFCVPGMILKHQISPFRIEITIFFYSKTPNHSVSKKDLFQFILINKNVFSI
jgi:hypothetical protein